MRRRILFSGQVQGVGFRFTACDVAGGLPVTGYVRNLYDGDVEVVAEGAPADLDRFLARLAARFGGYISRTKVTESAASGEFAGFDVRF